MKVSSEDPDLDSEKHLEKELKAEIQKSLS